MEAVPRLPFISFELKVSPESTRFASKLKRYISEAYREDPESYSNELHQLEGLRSAAVRPTTDSAGLSALIRYFCQIRSLQSRFPMAKGQPAACSFTWRDLYASNLNCSLAEIRFEMSSIMYNIGALHTQLGASEPRNTADSMKAACTHFQNAAWAFQHLKEHYSQPSGTDVSSELMRLLQEICFAQAQECILEKSIQDTRKPSVVGSVATQVKLFYKNSLALLGPSSGTDTIHEIIGTKLYNYWHRSLSFKSFYVGSIICLYQAMNAEEQQKMGERVAFYQQAVENLIEARKLAKYIEPIQVTQEALTFTNDVVEGKRKAAKNENEFIYHEEVPEKDLLSDMKPVCLVKPLPINFNDPEVSGPDLFSRLVPMGAHEASSMYSEEKAKLLRHIMSQVDAKNTELTEFMSSLQLDQLDIIASNQDIPQEIIDRSAAMNAKTEVIEMLSDSMNSLAEIITDVEHALEEIKTLIQEETVKEKEFQQVMGVRPASLIHTEIAREYRKYMEAHTRTTESNQVLHKAMTLHIANLLLLVQPLEVLRARIPSVQNIEGLDRATMVDMRRVVCKAQEMQSQRDSLVQQLRDALAADDVTAQLLARSTEPPEDIFKQELEKHTPTVKIIEQNLAAQENIINKLTTLYASYGDSRRMLADVMRKREGLINALITSYDTYNELLGKSQKGQEFYRRLSHSVSALLARVRSTCQVNEEERATQLAAHRNNTAASTQAAIAAAASKPSEPAPANAPRKLKDYLPYMKNRNQPRPASPNAQVDQVPPEPYYPESIYPTSLRPAPVGSEATDVSHLPIHDGIVHSMHNMPNQYDRYATPYAPPDSDRHSTPYAPPENEPYSVPPTYAYPTTSRPDGGSNFGYSAYTPSQFSQMADPQNIYSNPCYSASQNNNTIVTDSQNPMAYPPNAAQANVNSNNQYNTYDSYPQNQVPGPIPEAISAYNSANQTDLNMSFAQMQVGSKPEINFGDYSQTYYSVNYPQVTTPNVATYSNAAHQNIMATSVSEYSSINYPYSGESSQYGQPVNTSVSFVSTEQYSYPNNQTNTSNYPVYTNAENSVTSTTSISDNNPYQEPGNPSLAQLDAMDKPIKSHVTGEALSSYQNYDAQQNFVNPDQSYQATNAYPYPDQSNNYGQSYQNHPGYTFNATSGGYDYNYGSQNSYTYDANAQANVNPQSMNKDPNCPAQGGYTSAGSCDTVQSPSEQTPQASESGNNQTYYNSPYGYQTVTNQSVNMALIATSVPVSTNYGANMNQSTYMHSGQEDNTSVTFTGSQVSSPVENVAEEPNFNKPTNTNYTANQSTNSVNQPVPADNQPSYQITQPEGNQNQINQPTYSDTQINQSAEKQVTQIPEELAETKPEPSIFDLLSEIDFSVDQKPLMPEIKVPQISESAIKKPGMMPRPEPVKPVIKEELIERPAKKDIFSDPSLVNNFTQEVKNLQKLLDSLTNKTAGGLTVLDSKWKSFQDVQTKENMTRSKRIATQHTSGSIVTEVVPYDDSRLTLKSDPDAYINASYYKQLAPWCIPLVISSNPPEDKYTVFWKAVLEKKITCIVCLLTDIEMQGKSYWPTAKGQCLELNDSLKVMLDEVTCTVHWTERKLTVAMDKTVLNVTHYQINVFPAKIACSPLVLLADRMLGETFGGRLSNQLGGAWLQCGAGAGRCSVLALLLMAMCQVRAGYIHLCDMLDMGCVNLYKHRSNVLEDTKYLADAYRTVLFYVQGVLCSGTTMFSGEAVSVQSGASVLPPVTPTPNPTTAKNKFSRESFEEMKQSPGLKSGDMKDPLNFLDPLWSLKKK